MSLSIGVRPFDRGQITVVPNRHGLRSGARKRRLPVTILFCVLLDRLAHIDMVSASRLQTGDGGRLGRPLISDLRRLRIYAADGTTPQRPVGTGQSHDCHRCFEPR